ncbi:MAG: class I SAM-dependent methyltransferase [Acutalibacteraceae bacterium]|nr:class I SAM-dependent methyltransferase [Acutalibacteraceae bacterium]
MRPLSKRLQVIFDLVPVGSRVADIGTDHAYLPIALSLSGKCSKIIACDINEKPLNKAKENIARFRISDIETRLGDGISPVNAGEADTIIVAGMGGDVISHILQSCQWLKNNGITLLLQPMTSAEILRTYLFDNSYEITKEIPLTENGKVYTVICARFSGKKVLLPMGSEYTGMVTASSEEGRLYLSKQFRRIDNCIEDIKSLSQKTDELTYLTKVREHIKDLLENL